MTSRLFAGLLVLLAVAAWKTPVISGSQNPTTVPAGSRWEYRIIRLDSAQCSNESALNKAGREGWELVSYSPIALSFPQNAQGSLLIRPDATGPGKANNPPTADSFSGTINMKLATAHADACQAVFKRLWMPTPG